MADLTCIIEERGNGFPDVGDYCSDGDSLFRVESTSRIHTGRSPGRPNWMQATVSPADWSDCPEEDEHSAQVVIDGEG